MQLLLEKNKDWVVLKTDAMQERFQFSTQSTGFITSLSSFPEIGNHVNEMYSELSPLIYLMNNNLVMLSIVTGGHSSRRSIRACAFLLGNSQYFNQFTVDI